MIWRGLPVILVGLLLSSCGLFGGDKRPAYQGAEYYKNLEIPPDLTAPDTRDRLDVPRPGDAALQRFRENNRLTTVIPGLEGIRVVNRAGMSWLEVDKNIETVWDGLARFWQQEGIEIARSRPLLGFMETQWTERLTERGGFLQGLIHKLEPTRKDRFRLRLESLDGGSRTRIFIAHRRIERVVAGEEGEEVEAWVTLPYDLEAERELLSRLALFAGLSADQRQQLMAGYQPYSPLAEPLADNTLALSMKGSMAFVRMRARQALDRMQMDAIETDEAGNIHFVAGRVFVDSLQQAEDELAESSWLQKLFRQDEADIANDAGRRFQLRFTPLGKDVRIDVLDDRDSTVVDEDGQVTGSALGEQVRDALLENL